MKIRCLGDQGRHRNVTVRNELDEFRVWVIEHDVKVLDSVHALQALPIFEPDDMLGLDLRVECLPHVVLDLPVGFWRRYTGFRVIFEFKFSPDDEMDDLLIYAVRPIIVENFDVLCGASTNEQDAWATECTIKFEWLASRSHCLPLQPFVDYEVHNRPILLYQAVRVLAILPQIRWNTVELIDTICACISSQMSVM